MADIKTNMIYSGICQNTYWNQFYTTPSTKNNISRLSKKDKLLNR